MNRRRRMGIRVMRKWLNAEAGVPASAVLKIGNVVKWSELRLRDGRDSVSEMSASTLNFLVNKGHATCAARWRHKGQGKCP